MFGQQGVSLASQLALDDWILTARGVVVIACPGTGWRPVQDVPYLCPTVDETVSGNPMILKI